jgi:hypothetical protein
MNGRDEPQKAAGGVSRRRIVSLALVASGVIGGGILAGTTVASAQSSTSSTSTSTAMQPPSNVSHGPGETLLAGTAAAKVKAAALAAVPGDTIIRVETDSAGSPYEAHLKKSDGSVVTVKVDDSFKATTTESGFGAGAPASQSGGTGA